MLAVMIKKDTVKTIFQGRIWARYVLSKKHLTVREVGEHSFSPQLL